MTYTFPPVISIKPAVKTLSSPSVRVPFDIFIVSAVISPESRVIVPPVRLSIPCVIDEPPVIFKVTEFTVVSVPSPIMLVFVLISVLFVEIESVPLFTIPFWAVEFISTFPVSVAFASADVIFSTAPSVCAVFVILRFLYVTFAPEPDTVSSLCPDASIVDFLSPSTIPDTVSVPVVTSPPSSVKVYVSSAVSAVKFLVPVKSCARMFRVSPMDSVITSSVWICAEYSILSAPVRFAPLVTALISRCM